MQVSLSKFLDSRSRLKLPLSDDRDGWLSKGKPQVLLRGQFVSWPRMTDSLL